MQDNIIVSLVTMIIMEGFKRIKAVPINQGQMGRIRFVVGFLCLFGSIGTAYVNGAELDKDAIQIFSDTIINYVMTSGWYAGVVKMKSTS